MQAYDLHLYLCRSCVALMPSSITQDSSCVRYLNEFLNSRDSDLSPAVAMWGTLSACYFLCAAFMAYKMKRVGGSFLDENSGAKFNLIIYLRLLLSGLFFCGVSQLFLSIRDPSFSPPKDVDPYDISARFVGNKHIVTWQLFYAIGNAQLCATKIFVLERLLSFSASHSTFARLHAPPPRIQKTLWSIFATYCCVFVGASSALFFATLFSSLSPNVYTALNSVIAGARSANYIALAIIFACGGYLSRSIMQRSLEPLYEALSSAAGSTFSTLASATITRNLMRGLVFKLQLPTAWNAFWFLVVVLFYLLLVLGLSGKNSDDWSTLFDMRSPTLTRSVPFLIAPAPTFVVLMASDVIASMLTLWAMLKPQYSSSNSQLISTYRS
jgi:hypothetical protein